MPSVTLVANRPDTRTLRELPYVSSSVVKVSVLGLACLIAAGSPYRD
jgi:hypothetical protein